MRSSDFRRRQTGRALRAERLESRALLSVSPIGPEVPINAVLGDTPTSAPSLASNGIDRVVAAWSATDGNPSFVRVRKFDAQGLPYAQETTLDVSGSSAVVAYGPNDHLVVAATSYSEVRLQLLDADLQPQSEVLVANSPNGGEVASPGIAVAPDGTFLVFWQSQGAILARRFSEAGEPLSAEFRVDANSTNSNTMPYVSADGEGNAVVVWNSRSIVGSTYQYEIQARRITPLGVPIGGVVPIAAPTSAVTLWPRVALSPDGTFVATWTRSTTNGRAVLARVFDSAGAALSAELPIGTEAMAWPAAPTFSAPNRFLLAWSQSATAYPGQLVLQEFSLDGTPMDPPAAASLAPAVSASIVTVGGEMLVSWLTSTIDSPDQTSVTFRRIGAEPDSAPPQGVALYDSDYRSLTVRPAVRNWPTLQVQFTDDMNTAGGSAGPASILNAANWHLSNSGNDISGLIDWIAFRHDSGTSDYVATLHLMRLLPQGSYELRLLDTVTDAVGNRLDGNADRAPGGDYVVPFMVGELLLESARSQIAADAGATTQLKFDALGNYVLAWDHDGGVYVQRFHSSGTPLSAAFRVNAEPAWTDVGATLAVAPDGSFAVGWALSGGGAKWRQFDVQGAPIDSEHILDSVNTRPPAIAARSDGAFVVVSEVRLESHVQIYSPQGDLVGEPIELPLTEWITERAAISNPQGYVLYVSHRMQEVKYSLIDPEGNAIVTNASLDTTSVPSRNFLSVAVRSDGVFAVAWSTQHPSHENPRKSIDWRLLEADGALLGPVHSDTTEVDSYLDYNGIAFDDDGRVLLAMSNFGPGLRNVGIFFRRYELDGTPASDMELVIPDWMYDWGSLALGVDPSGRGGLFYHGKDDTLYLQRFTMSTSPAPRLGAGAVEMLSATGAAYQPPVGSGEQLRTVPLSQVDRIRIRFPLDVAVRSEDLTVNGQGGGDYAVAAFAYDESSLVATWSLSSPIVADEVALVLSDDVVSIASWPLDGEWDNPNDLDDPESATLSGDGQPGCDFVFRFTVLSGDANRDNRVTGADFTIWADKFDGGHGPADAVFTDGDFNGDGHVTGADYTLWADHFSIDQTATAIAVERKGRQLAAMHALVASSTAFSADPVPRTRSRYLDNPAGYLCSRSRRDGMAKATEFLLGEDGWSFDPQRDDVPLFADASTSARASACRPFMVTPL